jgi:hypothetical protein
MAARRPARGGGACGVKYEPDVAREYSESLGQIGAGWWRQIAWAHRQGIPESLGMTTREWVAAFVGGWVQLPIEDRREAVRELTSGPDALTNVEAAAVLGVSKETVRIDRRGKDLPLGDDRELGSGKDLPLGLPPEERARLALDAALAIDLPTVLSVVEEWHEYASPLHRELIERASTRLRAALGVQRLERVK